MRYVYILTVLIFLLLGCGNDDSYMEGRITTLKVTEISSQSAILNGKIEIVTEGKDVKPNIVIRGFCWGETPNNLEYRVIDKGKSEGNFSCSLGDLSPNTKYYIKAYVSIEHSGGSSYDNNVIAFYGNIIEFVTDY